MADLRRISVLATRLPLPDPTLNSDFWMFQGACGAHDPKYWYPNKAGNEKAFTKYAKAVCITCPVKVRCLRYAIDNNEYGTWGGMTFAERIRNGLQKKRV